jgi:hypothetical protein
MTDFFTRDGHLTVLSLERYLAGEVGDSTVQDHIGTCAVCATRLQALREDGAANHIQPRALPKRSVAPVYGALLAAAAAVAIYVAVPKEPGVEQDPTLSTPWVEPADYFRVKGSLNVEFFVKRAEHVTKAKDGDPVYAGDRMGFRISTPRAGQLMIAGIDGQGDPYLCYPQGNEGRSMSIGPTKSLTTLDQAIVLDEVLGQEDLVAVFCEEPFEFDRLSEALRRSRLEQKESAFITSAGCRTRTIRLTKKRAEPL